jgi:hypothetical protein
MQIAVFCDRCGTETAHDYLVHDRMTRAERLAVARNHMAAYEGWSCGPDGDFCPECRQAPVPEREFSPDWTVPPAPRWKTATGPIWQPGGKTRRRRRTVPEREQPVVTGPGVIKAREDAFSDWLMGTAAPGGEDALHEAFCAGWDAAAPHTAGEIEVLLRNWHGDRDKLVAVKALAEQMGDRSGEPAPQARRAQVHLPMSDRRIVAPIRRRLLEILDGKL